MAPLVGDLVQRLKELGISEKSARYALQVRIVPALGPGPKRTSDGVHEQANRCALS